MSYTRRFWRDRPASDTAGGTPVTVSRVAILLLAVGFAVGRLAGVELSLRVQAGVYLLGMVAMNLPHGGYEHFENLRRRAAAFQRGYVGAYLLSVALFVGLLLLAPVAGLALAVSVAMAKGGLGGLKAMDALYGTGHLRTGPQRWLAAAVRGGTVMIVPMVFWPETFYAFSSIMVSIFEPGALAGVAGDLQARRLALGVGFGGLLATHLGLGYWRSAGTGSFVADAAETLLLVTYFAVVPVVVAVGLYFPLWYSARQVARTTAIDDEAVEADERGWLDFLDADDPRLVALGAWGVLIAGSIATFGLAALVWTLAPQPLGGASLLPGLVAFWSIFVSIIALPHVVVGGLADRERGIWYVP
ncbi:Brp/Blh family beta-carotene 15,15'-dioxygenase [Haloarcula rara]|uniref:Brp/Blh family beta-carotene 15,15'-dioxygenase n=1 Tax=Haloarcula rara TaxID=3033387 RepID=UPI0023E81FAA|nr:Brp/Blh family beta-carotene 15,15'-dioxygenase [Halomicroarcula sp. SHR3]